MAAVIIQSDFGAQENKVCHCFYRFPIYLPWSDDTRCDDLGFLNVEFLSQLFHSPLSCCIKSLFSSSSPSATRVVSSAYLRLLIFLPAILLDSSLCFIQPDISHDVLLPIMQKEMAAHSSILAWRIPWTEEPGGLQSIGLQRVGHDWVTNTTLCI